MRLGIVFILFISTVILPQNRWIKLNGPEGAVIAGLYMLKEILFWQVQDFQEV
jgi:hypothetical protein